MSRDRALSDPQGRDADGGLIQSVRSAIAAGDRTAALRLLRTYVEGTAELSTTLNPAVGDALVATARGALPDDGARAVLEELDRAQQARGQIIELLTQTPFSVADLAAIRRVRESMESSAHETEEQAAHEDVLSGQAVPDGDLAACGWSSGTSRSALRQEVRAVPLRSMEGRWTQAFEVSEKYRAMRSTLCDMR